MINCDKHEGSKPSKRNGYFESNGATVSLLPRTKSRERQPKETGAVLAMVWLNREAVVGVDRLAHSSATFQMVGGAM